MAQAVSRRPLTAEPGFDPRLVHVAFIMERDWGMFFSSTSDCRVSIIPPVLHTYVYSSSTLYGFST
jgi:hypothetical protein